MSRWSTAKLKIYCIEEYRRKHGMTAPDTVKLFDEYGVFGFMSLPAMQWQSLENAVLDIEEYIEARSEPHHQGSDNDRTRGSRNLCYTPRHRDGGADVGDRR